MSAERTRILALDYLKCVFINLMIIFHLVYIGDTYPVAKQFVYTFHMPGFLIISGYLLNVNKPVKAFGRSMLWILVPYMIMEAGYIVMASVLPIREHVAHLTPFLFFGNLFVHPLGPYWYLHTLILCSIMAYTVFRFCRVHAALQLIVLATCFWAVSRLGLLSWSYAAYFWLGAGLSRLQLGFQQVFRPSVWSLPLLVGLVVLFPESMNRETFGGMIVVCLMLSFLLWSHGYLPARSRYIVHFIGRNTLILLLFSPVFTVLSKSFQPMLLCEPTGMLFMVVALLFTLCGSFAIAYFFDLLQVSRYFFGRERAIQ